jgi:iron complex transport system ATP-binding protein
VAMHDLNLASRFSDRMLMLKQGCIFAVGTPESVLTEEHVESVYGVKVHVTSSVLDRPQITPLTSETNGIRNAKISLSEIATNSG